MPDMIADNLKGHQNRDGDEPAGNARSRTWAARKAWTRTCTLRSALGPHRSHGNSICSGCHPFFWRLLKIVRCLLAAGWHAIVKAAPVIRTRIEEIETPRVAPEAAPCRLIGAAMAVHARARKKPRWRSLCKHKATALNQKKVERIQAGQIDLNRNRAVQGDMGHRLFDFSDRNDDMQLYWANLVYEFMGFDEPVCGRVAPADHQCTEGGTIWVLIKAASRYFA